MQSHFSGEGNARGRGARGSDRGGGRGGGGRGGGRGGGERGGRGGQGGARGDGRGARGLDRGGRGDGERGGRGGQGGARGDGRGARGLDRGGRGDGERGGRGGQGGARGDGRGARGLDRGGRGDGERGVRGGQGGIGRGARGWDRGGGRGGGERGGRGGQGGSGRSTPGRGRGAPGDGRDAQGLGGTTSVAEHVTTVGVKRPGYGTAGERMRVSVNACVTSIPTSLIHHYDVAMLSGNKTYPMRFSMQLMKELQSRPEFHPAGAYDGKKNLFMSHEIDLGPTKAGEFDVALARNGQSARDKPPPVYKIRITKVAEINPEVLQRFVNGQQSQDERVLTAITAMNVIIRMAPTMQYPFNSRSFFTDTAEKRVIGHGLELWRGYFQSVRPAAGRMLINVDISTGMFYRPGPLISLALDFFGTNNPRSLSPEAGFSDRYRVRLQKFISGIRISVKGATPNTPERIVTVHKLTAKSARDLTFKSRDGKTTSVAEYFRKQSNRPLEHPGLVCAETASGAAIPLERCTVLPGQLSRREIPPEVTKAMVEFSTKRPAQRLESIQNGLAILGYGQSEYMKSFGMTVDTNDFPSDIDVRVIPPPKLKYGNTSKQPVVVPRYGSWNMMDKHFIQPVTISRWMVIVFETQNRFNMRNAMTVVKDFIQGCQSVGMRVLETDPTIEYANGQGSVADHIKRAGQKCMNKNQKPPELLLVILPDGGNDIYRAVKHFGDVTVGVATQCLKASACSRAKMQYWANVCLKVNPKLGGVNVIPDSANQSFLVDPQNPTIIMGADVMHPAPGSDAPSFTAVVGSVDAYVAKYVATSRAQTSRVEIIQDLAAMSKELLQRYIGHRRDVEKKTPLHPKRLIFLRDGVSEGQFKEVMEKELAILKDTCKDLGISPLITFIVVGKRHHYRMFPPDAKADKSGNCPAGTVADQGITHPLEFDFYLQSHGGLLGTSRSAHYSVLYDDNKFTADALQSFAYTLCHVYARSTRSVSIPAPVYYADIVCSRAKNHYDPGVQPSETVSVSSGGSGGSASQYKPLHPGQAGRMYFM